MNVFENKFVKISFNEELLLMNFLWSNTTKKANNIFVPMTNAGVKKLAMLVSTEFIAQISLEQFSDEAEDANAGFVTKYFDTREEAMKWFS